MASNIDIWGASVPGFKADYGQPAPFLTPYLVESSAPTGAIIVCPGGGYQFKADYEGGPVAVWLNTLGISAFVLDYRVSPYQHPYPVADARRAIQVVRSRAAEWNIAPHKIGILGFSAGGHVAASAGTYSGDAPLHVGDAISAADPYPSAMILCYPVITFVGDHHHSGSMTHLLGENPSPELRNLLSPERHVSAKTPPTFLWHTVEDDIVPVENSLLFAEALSKHHIPFELHVFPHGRHGLAMCDDDPVVRQWLGLCATWLKSLGY